MFSMRKPSKKQVSKISCSNHWGATLPFYFLKVLEKMKSENQQATETLAALRFMITSGLMPSTADTAVFMMTLVNALDKGIAAINQLELKEGEK